MDRKLNIIIDFNNIAMRALHTCPYMGEGDIKNFDTQQECSILARKIMIDISYVLRLFGPDRTIFACDSKSLWRNDIYDSIPGERYKGTREKDNAKNWTNIFNVFSDVKTVLSDKGFVVTELNRTEADDIAAMWKSRLFTENGGCILFVSSDRDWNQLVDFNASTKSFCAVFNPISNNKGRKKLYINESFDKWIHTPVVADIFFSNKDNIRTAIENAFTKDDKIEYEIINPTGVVLEKIMCGDDGDNVPAFFDHYKNGKKMRLTPLKTKHIFESLNVSTIDDLENVSCTNLLKNEIEKEMKCDVDIDTDERLKRQRTLVELNPELFPEKIRIDFEREVFNKVDVGYVQTNGIKMESLLEGTKYLSKDYNSRVRNNSVFDDVMSLEKYIKPVF